MLKKIFLGLFATAMILAIVYMLGPKVKTQELQIEFPEVPTRITELEEYLRNREDSVIGLKEGNEAYIVWADTANKTKTPYSIVYIHGFGAGPMEGDPVHRFLADHFGANLFVTRLPEHGIRRENGMAYLTAQKLADAAGEAYQIGKSLGDKVIVVGTSMGGALTLLLASQQPDIHALVLYSPAIRDGGSRLEGFFKPWTKWLMEKTMMENSVIHQQRKGEKAAYWSEDYHINGYESLAVLLYSEMNQETFSKVTQPLFLGYYYKNDQEQDFVVSVPKMLEMYSQVGTDSTLKREMAFPKTGDHVIASSITSQDWQTVLFSTIDFLENVAKVPAREVYQKRVEEMTKANELLQKMN
ncbi:carboxylesterase [Algoriphagus sp. AK58]|uniref:alpha/beta hydrolase n=1 Tax=Algoriphagus sp. AK58 TaxID=1406877 RepID=UPI00164F4D03|nr:alpha/beta hydrolase [Algoriphagus sp. AK58]MBC6366013.1 alpha/beta hydrolase [Algoriphagus sp. AK58]